MGKSPGIDALKGALILWVIIGHVAEVNHVQNIVFWIGSGIRMPLLVGVSGYLLNLERVQSAAFADLAGRYGRRLIFPWLVAAVVYLLLGGGSLDWWTPVSLFLRAPYHLWYIPVLCSLILMTRMVRLPPLGLMLLAAPVTVAALDGLIVPPGPVGEGFFSFDGRFLHFPFFFFLGMVVARGAAVPGQGWLGLALAGGGGVLWASLYEVADPVSRTMAQMVMDSGLIALLPMVRAFSVRIPILSGFGQQSLFHYLWHPFVIGIATAQGLSAPVTLLVAVLSLILSCHMLQRVPAVGGWFGITARKAGAGRRQDAISPYAEARPLIPDLSPSSG
ncbi:MAG: acyltransferase family protein [Sphingobium sp.]